MSRTKKDIKEELFVSYYLGEARMNATDAAEMAGFKAANRGSLQTMGSEILNRPSVQKMLTERVDQVGITQQELLEEMAEIARWDYKNNMPVLEGMEANANAKVFDTMMRAKLTMLTNLMKLNTSGLKDKIEQLKAAFEQHRVEHPNVSDEDRVAMFKPRIDPALHDALNDLMKKAENRKRLKETEELIADPMLEKVDG